MKKGVLKNFANFTGKYLRWSLFLIKWQTFWIAILLKRDSKIDFFPVNIREFLRTTILKLRLKKMKFIHAF